MMYFLYKLNGLVFFNRKWMKNEITMPVELLVPFLAELDGTIDLCITFSMVYAFCYKMKSFFL